MLIAATNQQPRAPSCEQEFPNVAPKNALTPAGAIFRGISVHWQADWCSGIQCAMHRREGTNASRARARDRPALPDRGGV